MITLRSGRLTASISSLGAELQSVQYDGAETLWQGDPAFWEDRSPLLFPVCSSLKEGRYIYRGYEYHMPMHGFARSMDFEVERQDDSSAVFLLRSDEITRELYPFEFELRVQYSLADPTLRVDYQVKNTGLEELLFSIGGHEGFLCPRRSENYELLFSAGETPPTQLMKNGLLTADTVPLPYEDGALPLRDELFVYDTLIFHSPRSGSVLLRDRTTGRGVRFDFSDFPYFLVWAEPGADFVCLEPWHGTPDREGSSYDLAKKADMIRLLPGGYANKTHSFKILT